MITILCNYDNVIEIAIPRLFHSSHNWFLTRFSVMCQGSLS